VNETERNRLRAFQLAGGAVALGVVTQFGSDRLWSTIHRGGVLALVGFLVTTLLGVLALASLWASRPRPPARRTDRQLAALAEQAEDRLIALGSHAGGMAATEWFRANEKALHAAVQGQGRPVSADSVDDLARICDALDAWYVRERRGAALLALAERQATLAAQTGRHDLAEIAAARAATAYRLRGDPDAANSWLGTSEGVAPRGRTAAALQVRRQVEWALLRLARADRREGDDRTDEVATARDRLDEAASLLPRADVDADLAVRIDLGLVCLYRGEADPALEHLLLAAARAHQVRNAGLQAHATELAGVAAWMQGNRPQAEAWWNEAMRLYADIEDREGRGRCLQHLGSAAQARGDAVTAVRLLEESIGLRDGAGQLAARYLAAARGRLGADGPAEPGRPARRPRLTMLFRRLFQWLFRR
jgi:tetratricopeptide (TPR) repeat protein